MSTNSVISFPEPSEARQQLSLSRARVAQRGAKRLKRMLATVPDVVSGKDPEAIHDYRVYARRLQQALDLLYPKPRAKAVRALRRTLRRSRRLMTPLRTADVVLELVAKHGRPARNAPAGRAWQLMRGRLRDLRKREHTRVCRKLKKLDPMAFMGKARALLATAPVEGPGDLELGRHAVALLQNRWQGFSQALDQSAKESAPQAIHAARIAVKRLRYVVELLAEVGVAEGKPFLPWLRRLQQSLGDWHDQVDLEQALSETLAQPREIQADVLRARAFLRLIEQARQRQKRHLQRFFAYLSYPDRARLEACVTALSGEPKGKTELPEEKEAVVAPQSSS